MRTPTPAVATTGNSSRRTSSRGDTEETPRPSCLLDGCHQDLPCTDPQLLHPDILLPLENDDTGVRRRLSHHQAAAVASSSSREGGPHDRRHDHHSTRAKYFLKPRFSSSSSIHPKNALESDFLKADHLCAPPARGTTTGAFFFADQPPPPRRPPTTVTTPGRLLSAATNGFLQFFSFASSGGPADEHLPRIPTTTGRPQVQVQGQTIIPIPEFEDDHEDDEAYHGPRRRVGDQQDLIRDHFSIFGCSSLGEAACLGSSSCPRRTSRPGAVRVPALTLRPKKKARTGANFFEKHLLNYENFLVPSNDDSNDC